MKMTNKTHKKFARIFDTTQYGQVLLVIGEDDHGDACLHITADTHPEYIQPTTLTMHFDPTADAAKKLERFTQEQAEAFAAKIYSSVVSLLADGRL